MNVSSGSASNYWDATLCANNSLAYISPNGDSRNFSLATYVPTNALNRLVVGTRRGQGNLEGQGWRPGPDGFANRIAGDGFVGPVGLEEEVTPVVVAFQCAGANAVLTVSNTLAGALYEWQTATNGLTGGWSVLTNLVPSGATLTLTGTVHNTQHQFWRVKGPL
jgi:hypothetical protein